MFRLIYVRHCVPCTNLYRLSGTSDGSPEGKIKAQEMYVDLVDYIEKLQNKSINLLFDRTFTSEEVYCRLGLKEYSFTDVFEILMDRISKMDFEIYYITLYLSNENEFDIRLNRESKGIYKFSKFSKENSINQQNAYLNLANELKIKYPNINVINIDTCIGIDKVKETIVKIFS